VEFTPVGSDPAREADKLRETARSFLSVTSVRVNDALDTATSLAGQLTFAMSVAFLASARSEIERP
jgi:predicted lysophospholipase L1 biosynthesis ABC-type transport system permease subunit